MRAFLGTGLATLLLLVSPASIASDSDGSQPGDGAMTCEQIGMALMPYTQQFRSNSVQQLGRNAQEMRRRDMRREAEVNAQAAAESAEMEGACTLGTNATCAAASETMQARHDARNAQIAAEDKPLNDQTAAEMQGLAAQGQAMQQDPRLMHLMHLAEQKHCH